MTDQLFIIMHENMAGSDNNNNNNNNNVWIDETKIFNLIHDPFV